MSIRPIERHALMVCLAAAVLAGCGGEPNANVLTLPPQQRQGKDVRACPDVRPGYAHCDLLIRAGARVSASSSSVSGLGPTEIAAAYHLPTASRGSGQIVAIVDAFDNPNVAFDLATYRAHFGLPKAHFVKYNQQGQQKHYPPGYLGWAGEIDLDVEMVSASCPNCTIYLVEANAATTQYLEQAEAEAVKLGAHIVSNSWGGTPATSSGPSEASFFDAPGVVYLASAGDDGYGTQNPADFASVVAVGGTVLARNNASRRGWSEQVWHSSGGGCSTEPKPAWQHDPGCAYRTANDISAVAYDIAEYDTDYGWIVVDGTSISAPLLAGVYGLAGNAATVNAGKKLWTRRNVQRNDLFSVTYGINGSCTPTYLCQAGTKQYRTYSGPAGWGTPNGIGAF